MRSTKWEQPGELMNGKIRRWKESLIVETDLPLPVMNGWEIIQGYFFYEHFWPNRETFLWLQGQNVRPLFICVCIDPVLIVLLMCKTLIDQSVDLLNWSVPFSDPWRMSLTSNWLLAYIGSSCTQEDVFADLWRFESFPNSHSLLPTVTWSFPRGGRICGEIQTAGVDGLLAVDLPPELGRIAGCLRETGDGQCVYYRPNHSREESPRLQARHRVSFIVSREESRSEIWLEIWAAGCDSSKNRSSFGGWFWNFSGQVSEVTRVADGVVVGSALVNYVPKTWTGHTAMLSAIRENPKDW